MKLSFAIIGCGKVGTALGKHLARSGYPAAGFASRSADSARRSAMAAGAAEHFFQYAWEASLQADVVFITTPDGAIADICRDLADHGGIREKTVIFHCSGALPSTILSTAKARGAYVGSMHPLQSFALEQAGNPFDHIMMAVEGDPEAVHLAQQIASDLGALAFVIKTEGKTVYHAAASVASNYLVTLMSFAIKLIAASGVQESEAFQILRPLVNGTLTNIETAGIPGALTGPIARGDYKTVADHVAGLKNLGPDLLLLYKTLGRATVQIARAKGTLSADAALEILKLLD
ncbi:MAG: DUF2520 domain-containing protein [Desulfobacterales bacterium]|jgi:predicted short-subunit dehydrogenase-like oxidoreductase (DUF2520 family)|nr:DUF2520 domain-containing protein [Desulfobacterales bacterium]